eukprot:CAMPEP_0198116338 /NCGR_PEP_ID=MMETSP1442-20131203/11670_1 /TAXON_ID= /ORGANISM="Craspedostauros australis, Strain CCMP3328" /LENGTH=86 /DNA_ID=CAMNT_0043774127 /DNA_START=15 /DNA_END=278 /DNA_ORIENTATION=-
MIRRLAIQLQSKLSVRGIAAKKSTKATSSGVAMMSASPCFASSSKAATASTMPALPNATAAARASPSWQGFNSTLDGPSCCELTGF